MTLLCTCHSRNLEQNPRFFGRKQELQIIDEHLLPTVTTNRQRSLKSFGICGTGGLGKTQIAIQYVYTRRVHFDAIFWLFADDKNALGESFASIGQQIGIEDAADSKDLTVSRERVKEWLSNPLKSFDNPDNADNEALWLLVFDNADNLSILDEFWPLTGRGSVLLTSRDPVAKTSFYTENQGIDLSKLSLEETMQCIRFLTKSTLDTDNGRSLARIAEMLDGLMLGIEQVSSIIRRLRLSYEDFLTLYNTQSQKLLDMLPDDSQGRYPHSLSTVWSLQQFSVGSDSLLQMLAMLDPDSVPEILLTAHLNIVELEGYPSDELSYFEARGQLIGSSLVSLVNQAELDNQLRLYRLLQDVVTAKMEKDDFYEVHAAAVRLERCAALLTHIASLKKVADRILASNDQLKDDIKYAALINDAGCDYGLQRLNDSRYLFERGLMEEAQTYYLVVEKLCIQSDRKGNEDVQDMLRECYNNLGTLANEMNDAPAALRYFKIWKHMSLQRKAKDGKVIEDYELGMVYHELGIAYAFTEDYITANEHFLRAKKIFENLIEFKQTMLLFPVGNLGFTYCEQGRLEEAESILLKTIKSQADEFGPDDTISFKTGKLLHALGNVYAKWQRWDQSFEYHSRALAQYMATLGEGHARTGAARYRIVDHFIKNNQPNDAKYGPATSILEQS
ncbi:MAG: hypothetical protein Q9167_005908 [Letrouitia subvulpina]